MQEGLCIDNTYGVICGWAGEAGAGGVCDAKSATKGQRGGAGKGLGMNGMRAQREVFVTQTWLALDGRRTWIAGRAGDAGIGKRVTHDGGVCDGKSDTRGELGWDGKSFGIYGIRTSREVLVTAMWPAGDGRIGHLSAAYLSWFSFSTGGSGGEGGRERRIGRKWGIIWELVDRKYFRSCGDWILTGVRGASRFRILHIQQQPLPDGRGSERSHAR